MTTEEFRRDILRLQPRLQRTAESIVGDPDNERMPFKKPSSHFGNNARQ